MKKNVFIVRKIGSSKADEWGLSVPPELKGKQYMRNILENGIIQFVPIKE